MYITGLVSFFLGFLLILFTLVCILFGLLSLRYLSQCILCTFLGISHVLHYLSQLLLWYFPHSLSFSAIYLNLSLVLFSVYLFLSYLSQCTFRTFLVNFLSQLSTRISICPSYFSQYISFSAIFLNVSFVLSSESLFLSYLSQFILLSLTLLPSSLHSSLLSSKHVLVLYCLWPCGPT